MSEQVLQLNPSIVRIFKAGKTYPVGAGFLISDTHLMTCAHVVADAAATARDSSEPPPQVSLDFPLAAPGVMLTARVVKWFPVASPTGEINGKTEIEDIAVLELIGPRPFDSQPAVLIEVPEPWDHPFRSFGVPVNHDDGVWASGVLKGAGASGWVQLEGTSQTGYAVEPGYSGGAVWDETEKAVAGMVVAADTVAQHKAAFMIPTALLRRAWPDLGRSLPGRNPYMGLDVFKPENAPFFFGREVYTARLLEAVEAKPLVALLGRSGSGKSSVIYAGLFPSLKEEEGWVKLALRPKKQVFDELALALMPLLEPEKSDIQRIAEAADLSTFLQKKPSLFPLYLAQILQKRSGAKRILLLVDQFEELFTLGEKDKAGAFLELLLDAVDNARKDWPLSLTVVLTLRADFLDKALAYRRLADALQDADIKLGPMNRDELVRAIENPAKIMKVKVEESLTERILADVKDKPGSLPLLQFALTELWKLQQNNRLTLQAYEKLGGVEKALAEYATRTYQQINSPAEQKLVRQIFVQLVQPGSSTEDTRRLATRTEVGEENWPLIARLADRRLVITGRDEVSGDDTVELVHEALIRSWQQLRDWMTEERGFRVWQENLRSSLRLWEKSGQDDENLLRGKLLVEALEWRTDRAEAIGGKERNFIEASRANRQKQEELEKQALREKAEVAEQLAAAEKARADAAQEAREFAEEAERRALQEKEMVEQARQEAVREKERAEEAEQKARAAAEKNYILQLTASSKAAAAYDTQLSLLLALEAANRAGQPDLETRQTLRQAIAREYQLGSYRHGASRISKVEYSPSGDYVALLEDDNMVQIWKEWSLGPEMPLNLTHDGYITAMAFSPGQNHIATAGADKTARVWDFTLDPLPAGQKEKSPPLTPLLILKDPAQGSLMAVEFDREGRRILTAGDDGAVRVWDAASGALLSVLPGDSPLWTAGFIPPAGGESSDPVPEIYTLDFSNLVKVWNTAGKVELYQFKAHADWIRSVAVSPNGRMLATACDDKTAGLWDLKTGTALKTLSGHKEALMKAVFSPDSSRLLTASIDGTAKLWDVSTGETVFTLRGHTGQINDTAFNSDGKLVVTASVDNTVRVWESSTGKCFRILIGHRGEVSSAAFSPKTETLISSAKDGKEGGQALIWYLENTAGVIGFEGHTGSVKNLDITRDDQVLLSSGEDNTVRLWNVLTSQVIRQFNIEGGELQTAYFSRDNKLVLAEIKNGKSGLCRVWDRESGSEVGNFPGFSINGEAAFSYDGKFIVTVEGENENEARKAKIWEVETGKLTACLEGHTLGLLAFSFSPTAPLLATGGYDYRALLWRLGQNGSGPEWDFEKKEFIELPGRFGWVSSASFSRDGQRLITTSYDMAARLWDTAAGTLLATLSGHSDAVTGGAFSEDGSLVMTIGNDQRLIIWEGQSGEYICQIRSPSGTFAGASFSADSQLFFTAGKDNTVRIWDARTGEELQMVELHSDWVNSAVFSWDGTRMYSAGADGKIFGFSCELSKSFEQVKKIARSKIHRTFTEEERRRFGLKEALPPPI